MNILSTSIVSALNNYSSITPIVFKDSIENFGTTAMAYYNAGEKTRKYETTEKFIESNMTSVLWYGGIPFVKKMFDITAFKLAKLNPDIDLELLNKVNAQNIEEIKKKMGKKILPEKITITKGFFSKRTELVDVNTILNDIQKNAKKYKALHVSRMLLSTALTGSLAIWTVPQLIIAFTQRNVEKKKQKEVQKIKLKGTGNSSRDGYSVSFKSLQDVLLAKSALAQKTLLGDMVAVDLAISGSRTYYANKREKKALNGKKSPAPYAAALEKIIKEGGVLYLIYFGGKHIKAFVDKYTKNSFDPIIVEDKSFVSELRSGKFSKNPIKNMSESEALDFIDRNISSDENVFVKYAKKTKLIQTTKGSDNTIFRNPFKYLDVKALSDSFDEMQHTATGFLKDGGGSLSEFVKHKVKVKRIGVFANLIFSSFCACIVLPKLVYIFRKWYTGSNEEPGISKVIDKVSKQ